MSGSGRGSNGRRRFGVHNSRICRDQPATDGCYVCTYCTTLPAGDQRGMPEQRLGPCEGGQVDLWLRVMAVRPVPGWGAFVWLGKNLHSRNFIKISTRFSECPACRSTDFSFQRQRPCEALFCSDVSSSATHATASSLGWRPYEGHPSQEQARSVARKS